MKKLIGLVAAAGALIGTTLVAPAQADVQFEAEPCVITLAASYSFGTTTTLDQTVPNSVVKCPDFTFDPEVTTINAYFTGGSPKSSYTQLYSHTQSTYDAAANAIVDTTTLQLSGGQTGTFTAVDTTGLGSDTFYITHNDLHYRLVLSAPFTVTNSDPNGTGCTLKVPNLKYVYGQQDYFVIPDSAMKCTGFTFNSADYNFSNTFKSNRGGTLLVATTPVTTYDPATKTYTTNYQLQVRNIGYAGKFRESDDTSYVLTQLGNAGGTESRWPVKLARPFKMKYATTIEATPTSIAGEPDKFSLHIQADRNMWLSSGDVGTYRRQTVLPTRSVDHPTILRNGKEIMSVKLTKFGEATVTLENPSGKQKFTVQMAKTASNYAGQDSFKR